MLKEFPEGNLRGRTLRADWADEMISRLQEEKQQAAQSTAALIDAKRDELQTITGRLRKLLDAFLDGDVDRAAYTAKKAEFMSRKSLWTNNAPTSPRGEPIGSNRSKNGF